MRTFQCAWVVVGGHNIAQPALSQHRSQHTGARAHIHRRTVDLTGFGQRRFQHQIHILAAHRRKNPVVRVNAVAGRVAKSGYIHALLAPFMRTHHAHHLAQRSHNHGAIHWGLAPCFRAGCQHIGRTAQWNAVIGVERDQDGTQNSRALGLRLTVQVKLLRILHIGLT